MRARFGSSRRRRNWRQLTECGSAIVFGDDAQRLGPGALADVHEAYGAPVVGVVRDLEEDDLLAIVRQAVAHLHPQRLRGHRLAVERQLIARVELDDDGALAGGERD